MTYRELLLWLERDAERREDHELDMQVLLRIGGAATVTSIAALTSVEVDMGCTDEAALILDADVDEDPDWTEQEPE